MRGSCSPMLRIVRSISPSLDLDRPAQPRYTLTTTIQSPESNEVASAQTWHIGRVKELSEILHLGGERQQLSTRQPMKIDHHDAASPITRHRHGVRLQNIEMAKV